VSSIPERATALTADGLLEMSAAGLDALFRGSPPGEIPRGDGRGTIIAFPGSRVTKPASRVLGTLLWRGKVFHPDTNDLENKISPLSIRTIRAQVYIAESWLDDQPCVVLDYSKTSKVAGWIRDEIREVASGLYLGLVWDTGRRSSRRKLNLCFALTFPAGA
jgi:hypothetical protein